MDTLFFDAQADYAGSGVMGFMLIEDEVTDTVVNRAALEVLDCLKGMGVVADEDIGTSMYQLVGLIALAGNGLERVFASPVERNDDDGGGVISTQAKDTFQERVHRFLTDAGLVGQICIVLEGEA